MKRLPLLMDEQSSPLARAGAYLLVPVALTLFLPLLLLFILVLYLVAIFHGGRFVVLYLTGRSSPVGPEDFELQKPHFLEMHVPVNAIEQESSESDQASE